MRILITGANGHLGRRLARRLAAGHDVVAAVRSTRARDSLITGSGEHDLPVSIVDYNDPASLAEAATDCDAVVHLVGIIKESAANPYERAHEGASQALVEAASKTGIGRIVHVSISGSDPNAHNACLASKGRAEQILLDSGIPTIVLRVPMVLGEDDYASSSLARKACRRLNLELRAGSLEQPIYAGDVIEALGNALAGEGGNEVIELAGPECVTRRELIVRAGRLLGCRPWVLSLPWAAGMAMAGLVERLMSAPPVTRAMLGVLDHDDCIDPAPACARLGLELTPLNDTLGRVLNVSGR